MAGPSIISSVRLKYNMQRIHESYRKSVGGLSIYINNSPVQAFIINDIIKNNSKFNIIINSRGMETKFPNSDKEFRCKDESLINSRYIVKNLIIDLKNINKNFRDWTLYSSHGDSLLARIICAAGGKIHYIDDGLGTYAALADFVNKRKIFKKFLLEDKQFERPMLDRHLNYLHISHAIEKLINKILKIAVKFNLGVALFGAAVSKRLYKQYFRFDSEYKWKMNLLYKPFPFLENIEITNISLNEQSSVMSRVLILLPPYLQTDPKHFEFFLQAASRICRNRKYKYIYVKKHPADSFLNFPTKIQNYFSKKIKQIDIKNPVELSIWAYNNKFQEVVVFNTSSTFFAKKLINSEFFIWTDLYESVTGEMSHPDIVCEAL